MRQRSDLSVEGSATAEGIPVAPDMTEPRVPIERAYIDKRVVLLCVWSALRAVALLSLASDGTPEHAVTLLKCCCANDNSSTRSLRDRGGLIAACTTALRSKSEKHPSHEEIASRKQRQDNHLAHFALVTGEKSRDSIRDSDERIDKPKRSKTTVGKHGPRRSSSRKDEPY